MMSQLPALMKKNTLLLFVSLTALLNPVSAKPTPIPKQIDVGTYSVSLDLSPDDWRVEVFKEKQVIVYSFDDKVDQVGGIQLHVFRYTLPVAVTTDNLVAMADSLIMEDGLKFRKTSSMIINNCASTGRTSCRAALD